MMELTYIPLKTSDGQVAGHARVQDGFVELSLRAASGTQALILTESGYVTGEAGAHIRAGGRVLCVALHDRGKLRCCGFARGCPHTVDDVRARLLTLFPPTPAAAPRRAPEPQAQTPAVPEPLPFVQPARPYAEKRSAGAHAARTEREQAAFEHDARSRAAAAADTADPAPEHIPQEAPAQEASAPTDPAANGPAPEHTMRPDCARDEPAPDDSKSDGPAPNDSTPDGSVQNDTAPDDSDSDDSDGRIETVLARLRDASAAAFFSVPDAVPESPDDTANRAEAFAALLERCEAVFQKIDAAPGDDSAIGSAPAHVPSIKDAQDGPRRCAVIDWHDSVDALLASQPAARRDTIAQSPARAPVTNPFPHIFPDARFYSECDSTGTQMLIGTWRRGTEQFTVTAVHGEYSPRPPEHLPGFTRYIRTRQGGFWVRVDD